MDEVVFGGTAVVVAGLAALGLWTVTRVAAEAAQEELEFADSPDDPDPVW